MKMYSSLAPWWPILSLPADYAEEADSFLAMIERSPGERETLLELGSGGGNLASHMKAHFDVTLSDISPDMLAVSRRLNPELEHIEGDMRSLRLNRLFDLVLIHDAIAYCATRQDLAAALQTAAVHCRPGGTVLLAPDYVKETFEPGTDWGGHDAEDGRAIRYLEWSWDPDPADETIEVTYTIVIRESDGRMRAELDQHHEGLFAEATWIELLGQVRLSPVVVPDKWGRRVFVSRKMR
jgi:SAM-dependent methyltransferase